MITVLFLILISIGIGVLFYKYRPEATQRIYRWYKGSKTAILGVIGLLAALIFISSGTVSGTIIGVIAFILLAWHVIFEEPHEALR